MNNNWNPRKNRPLVNGKEGTRKNRNKAFVSGNVIPLAETKVETSEVFAPSNYKFEFGENVIIPGFKNPALNELRSNRKSRRARKNRSRKNRKNRRSTRKDRR